MLSSELHLENLLYLGDIDLLKQLHVCADRGCSSVTPDEIEWRSVFQDEAIHDQRISVLGLLFDNEYDESWIYLIQDKMVVLGGESSRGENYHLYSCASDDKLQRIGRLFLRYIWFHIENLFYRKIVTLWNRSLIFNRNRSGARTDPWGTLTLTE